MSQSNNFKALGAHRLELGFRLVLSVVLLPFLWTTKTSEI